MRKVSDCMNVLAVEAHPDDVEMVCSGTLVRLARMGHSISILSITAGECGSVSKGPEEVIQIRISEGEKAAAVLNGKFYYAGVRDKHIFFDKEVRNRVCEIFRIIKPDIVFALSPKDYIIDHETASMLARDSASAASSRNLKTGTLNPSPATDNVPYLYYCEPMFQIDIFGNTVRSTTYVDVADVMETREAMLFCHVSQREWLRHRNMMFDYIETMKNWAKASGEFSGFEYAEGFRQHVAPPFPGNNILEKLLDARVMSAV